MATAPQYAATPKVGVGQVTVANTNRDGTGTLATIFTAGANGSRIDRIRVQAVGTTTAGVVRLYLHDGANVRLYREILVGAITPSTSVQAFSGEVLPTNGLIIPTGYSLCASTHNAETFNVFVEGGDF